MFTKGKKSFRGSGTSSGRGMNWRLRGFTLIELLVVIAIIGVLSSVILASLNTARARARDAQRKATLSQLASATELYALDTGSYPTTSGWVEVPDNVINPALVPSYMASISPDPTYSAGNRYMYWRFDYNLSGTCTGVVGTNANRYGYYAKLENPTAADLAAFVDPFDQCVRTTWGMNYKKGN